MDLKWLTGNSKTVTENAEDAVNGRRRAVHDPAGFPEVAMDAVFKPLGALTDIQVKGSKRV